MLKLRNTLAILLAGLALTAQAAGKTAATPQKPENQIDDTLSPRENALRCFMAGAGSIDDPVRSAEYFLSAAFADEKNCDVPLSYLLRLNLSRQSVKKLLVDYDAFWQKHPENLKLVKFGIRLHKFAGEYSGMEKIILDVTAELAQKKTLSADEKTAWSEILVYQLEDLGRHQKFAAADNLIEQILPKIGYEAQLYTGLLKHYRRAAFQMDGYETPDRSWFSSERKYRKLFIDTLQTIRKQNDRNPDFFVSFGFPEFAVLDAEQDYRLEPGKYHLALFCHLASMLPEKEYRKYLNRHKIPAIIHPEIYDARNAFFNGKYDKCMEILTPELAQKTSAYGRQLRLLALRRTKPQLAVTELAQLKKSDPSYKMYLGILMDCAVELNDEKLFHQTTNRINELQMTPELANLVVYSSLLMGLNYPEAEKLLDYALQEEPDNAALIDSKGYWLLSRNRADEALRLFIKALKLSDGSVTPVENFYHIALAQEALKRHEEAAAACRLAMAFYKRCAANPEPAGQKFARELKNALVRMEKNAADEKAAKKAAAQKKNAGKKPSGAKK